MTLADLRINRRFTVKDCPTLRGKLLAKGSGSATVRYDYQTASQSTNVSLGTEVETQEKRR